MGVVGVILVRWIYSGAPCGSSGSFGFVGYIRPRPGGRRIHSGSLGSFVRALGVVGFILIHSYAVAGR